MREAAEQLCRKVFADTIEPRSVESFLFEFNTDYYKDFELYLVFLFFMIF